jgi:SAM-dependent methyltransferase
MRTQTQQYLEKFLNKHKKLIKCLDVGSMEAGGGAIRHLFQGREYIGVDMRSGPNVDVVLNGHDLLTKFDAETFDLVTCFDTFEHDDAFWLTLEQMKAVLKKGGWLIIGCPSRYCPEHDYPSDYWRFMPKSMKLMLEGFKKIKVIIDMNENFEDEVFGWGKKV